MTIRTAGVAQNPWFQLAAIATFLSAGIVIYNLLGMHQPQREVVRPEEPPATQLPQAPATLSNRKEALQPQLEAKTPGKWIVDATGSNDSDSKTIKAVLLSARSGDVILVRYGTYRETIELGTSQITIKGELNGDEKPTIEGFGTSTVSMLSGSATIENLVVLQSGGGNFRCIEINGGARLVLGDVDVIGTTNTALNIDNAVALLARCTLTANNTRHGVAFSGHSELKMDGCSVTGNDGGIISAENSSGTIIIKGSKITNNRIGVHVQGKDVSLDLEHCVISGNRELGVAGIGHLEIKTSEIFDNNWGLGVEGGYTTIADSKVHGNTTDGIQVRNAMLVIHNSEIYGNGGFGVSLLESAKAEISDSSTVHTNNLGVCAGQGSHLSLSKCKILKNKTFGVMTRDDKTVADVTDCEVSESSAGVCVKGGEVAISTSDLHDNLLTGLYLVSGGAKVSQSTIHDNQKGIIVAPPTTVTSDAVSKLYVYMCKINHNQKGGIFAKKRADVRIFNSDFTQNGKDIYSYMFDEGTLVSGESNVPPLSSIRTKPDY